MSRATRRKPGSGRQASLTKIPSNKTLQKRPILHPPIPAPKSGGPKVVYMSSKTPRVVAIKRVENYLDIINAAPRVGGRGGKRWEQQAQQKQLPQTKPGKEGVEGVTIRATGKAIQNALAVGIVFQSRGNDVKVTTGSVDVVDDVVDLPEGAEPKEYTVRRKKKVEVEEEQRARNEDKMEVDDDVEGDGDAMDVEEDAEDIATVTRVTSSVEVFISRTKGAT